MLKTRIITAGLLVAAFIPALFMLNNNLWAYLMLVIALLALHEWGCMIKLSALQNKLYVLSAGIGGIFVVWLITKFDFHLFFFKSLTVFFVVALFWLIIVPIWFKTRYMVGNKAVMALLGLLLLASLWLALICAKGADPALLLVLLTTIWIADSAAYFAGKNFGKHKLAPSISPGKTWEGVFGALIAVTIFGAILYTWFDFKEWAVFPALWIITILGVAGDLFESMIKRQAMLKDSGSLLPGHGGILDRIDGMIPSVPIAILMIYLYHHFNSVA
ncbi:MAG: phosphatidate cytidylyltransferase [Pseudomonadota bacterium]